MSTKINFAREPFFLDDKDPGSIEKGGRGYVYDAVYPGMWKQILGWHAFGYPVPACDCDPIQGPIKAETHAKAKLKHDVKAVLVSIDPPHRLRPFAFHAMQNTGGLSETQMNVYNTMARHNHWTHIYTLSKHCHRCHMRPITRCVSLIYIFYLLI